MADRSGAPVLNPSPPRDAGGAMRLVRAWFAVTSRVAPAFAEWQAARMFLTPPRRPPREPRIEGHGVERRSFYAEGLQAITWSWGSGPAVLLVHGWGGRAADMTALAEALVRAGFRAVAVDMPAHGHAPGRRTSLAEWIRLLPHLGREVGGAPGLHAVIGHSFGGAAVALALADGLEARGAALLAPAAGPAHFLEQMGKVLELPPARIAGMERRLVATIGREVAAFDATRAAASIGIPALVVHDPADPVVPWAHGATIARAWRGSELASEPGVGHYRIAAAPPVIARVVSFVGGLPIAPASVVGRPAHGAAREMTHRAGQP